MKTTLLLFLGLMSHQAFSSVNCINVSGTYEFKSFKGQDCSINDDSVMHLSPLRLGTDIPDHSVIVLKQDGCKNIVATHKYAYSKEKVVTVIDLKGTTIKNGQFAFNEKKSGTVHSFGTLSYSDKTSWTLGLDENKNLKVSFYHQSIGLFNGIVPTWDRVKMSCILDKK